MEKNYYAIIPANVRYDNELSANAKLLYGEITALTNHQGYCWATNGYFADLYKVSKVSISSWIKQLIDKGYVSSEIIYREGSKEILNRYLRIVNEPIKENFNTPIKENLSTPIKENFKDNNTVINITPINNTINNTNKNKQKKSDLENEFESLWKEYPRKLGAKKKARESYVKAIKVGSTTYEQVQYGIEMYKKYIDYHNIAEEFIKHGSTWFNQECWSNDYTCKPKVIQGKRHGFLGLVLNEMDYEKAQGNVIDHEESVNYGQETSSSVIGYATNSLPFGL